MGHFWDKFQPDGVRITSLAYAWSGECGHRPVAHVTLTDVF